MRRRKDLLTNEHNLHLAEGGPVSRSVDQGRDEQLEMARTELANMAEADGRLSANSPPRCGQPLNCATLNAGFTSV
jgi:hypothetical protein